LSQSSQQKHVANVEPIAPARSAFRRADSHGFAEAT
jgi:hypothetical protein